MKLTRSWPVGVLFSLALTAPAAAVATPIDWQAPWNVQLDQNQITGAGAKQRAFGVSATVDGQVVDLEADIALARAEAVVLAADSFAAARVEFERAFRLLGSPHGWSIGLQGVLTGSLFIATDPGQLGEANIIGRAEILDLNGNQVGVDENGNVVGLSIRLTESRGAQGRTSFVLDLTSAAAFLDDGNYVITGFLEANAVSLPSREPPPVIAQSLFFNGGWAVSISATPVPVPATGLLIGAALALMAARLLAARGTDRWTE